jgi:hypothetical protein
MDSIAPTHVSTSPPDHRSERQEVEQLSETIALVLEFGWGTLATAKPG